MKPDSHHSWQLYLELRYQDKEIPFTGKINSPNNKKYRWGNKRVSELKAMEKILTASR